MAHIRYDNLSHVAESDKGWYPVAAQIGREANSRARRSDITAVVRSGWPYGGKPAPACFIPSLAEVFLDTDTVPFGDLDKVNLEDALWRLEHAAMMGALVHEASHARHTKWDFDAFDALGATKRMIDVIVTLEEPRIERNALLNDTLPTTRAFLKGCAMDIVAKDFKVAETPYGASVAAGLILARRDAGVLTKTEVEPFRKDIVEVLGEPTLAVLRNLWQEFLGLRDTDYPAMVKIAREWLEALDLDPEKEETPEEQDDLGAGALFGEGTPGEGAEEPQEGAGGLESRIQSRARDVAAKVDQEVTKRRGAERDAREAAERKADAERKEAAEKPHKDAFPSHGYSNHVGSHLVKTRQPTPDERLAAHTLGKDLADLHFHDRVTIKTTSDVPPGRLRGRAMVGNAANRRAGSMAQVPMWQGRRHRVVPETPLTLGIMCDISGSMRDAMETVGQAQYIVADAGAQIDARVSTVHFGAKVHGILRAGQREKQVRIYRAGDGFECFRDGALALDKELNLLDARGARLLVVMSDGKYGSAPHKAYAERFVPLAIRKGVAVLWLNFTPSTATTYGATRVDVQGLAPLDVARLIGQAAAQEMRSVDQGR